MEPATRASLLWGIVGALSFLVGLQGYHIVVGEFVGVPVLVGVTALVGAATAVLAHALRPRVQAVSRPER